MAVLLDTDNTYKITRSSGFNTRIRTRETDYGDGYRVIIEDGINSEEQNPSLQFIPMDASSTIALETILKNSVKSASNYLQWTVPGESSAKYWTAHSISRTPTDAVGFYVISCSLRREYPLI